MNLLAGIPPGHQAALDSLGGRTASSGDLPFIGSKSGARPRALRGSQRLLRYVLAVGLCLLAMAVVFGTIWIVAVTAAKHATAALMQNPGLLAATPRPTVSRVRGVAPLVTPVAAQASPDPDATGLALPTLKPPPPTSPFSSSAEPSSPPKKPTCTRRDGYFDCLELYHAPSSSASRLPSRRIPRIIHQTGSTTSLTYKQHSWRATWVYYNPEWEMRFYDDAGCEAFVAHEFPEYLEVYQTLPKAVERADFFRYLVILRHGGMYADSDVECMMPIEEWKDVSPETAMVVGVEAEFNSIEEAYERTYVRKQQILQWQFMAAPLHPVLVNLCRTLAAQAGTQFHEDSTRDTLDRTGPGPFSDAVINYRDSGMGSAGTSWSLTLLPEKRFGSLIALFANADMELQKEDIGVYALHRFAGSWKEEWTKPANKGLNEAAARSASKSAGMGQCPGDHYWDKKRRLSCWCTGY